MRNVTSQELNTISAAVLYVDDLAINVPSTGIPSTHYYHIEFGYQLFLDGAWDQKTLLEYYVKNSVSIKSLECYTVNFENATFTIV